MQEILQLIQSIRSYPVPAVFAERALWGELQIKAEVSLPSRNFSPLSPGALKEEGGVIGQRG